MKRKMLRRDTGVLNSFTGKDLFRLLKAYEEVRAAMQLMRKIELAEARRTFAYADSMLAVKQVEVEELKKGFLFEKDTAYQSVGMFIPKTQQIERNVERSYLRSQVDEKGKMQLASVYFGASPIAHEALRVELPDGSFAETLPVPYDGGNNYRFRDNGNYSEIVTYRNGNDNGVVKFIYNFPKERIKATYLGRKKYVMYIDKQAKDALVATYNLAAVLSEIDRLQKEKVSAERTIASLQRRIENRENRMSAD